MQLFDVSPGMALVSVVMVIRAKNPVHFVLFFIFVSRNTSGLPLLLGFDFFAMILLVVYIGAIAVLFLFVVMMLDTKIAEIHENVLRYLPVGGIIGLIFWLEIFLILDNDYVPILPINLNTTYLRYTVYAKRILSWTNSETLGNLLYINYPVPFPVSSPISLVATIGATIPTMHKTTKVKRQDVFWQNAIDYRNTIAKIRFKLIAIVAIVLSKLLAIVRGHIFKLIAIVLLILKLLAFDGPFPALAIVPLILKLLAFDCPFPAAPAAARILFWSLNTSFLQFTFSGEAYSSI